MDASIGARVRGELRRGVQQRELGEEVPGGAIRAMEGRTDRSKVPGGREEKKGSDRGNHLHLCF